MSRKRKVPTVIVREYFYSLQGEGSRAGEPSIFIRLAFCNKNCWFCDTDWSYGDSMDIEELLRNIKKYPCDWIVWTGGEPTLQLNSEIVAFFNKHGYKQAMETNGTNVPPDGLAYITCSSKVEPNRLHRSFEKHRVNEFRYPVGENGVIPPPIKDLPPADYYYASPLFLGEEKKRFQLNLENLKQCISFVKTTPGWRLSIQQHKIWDIR
jgi:7-carboxy-7-deazaguanine synthase